jgi:hypothetical protein
MCRRHKQHSPRALLQPLALMHALTSLPAPPRPHRSLSCKPHMAADASAQQRLLA